MLWFDRAGMDGDDYASLARAVGGRRPRVLAWAPTAAGCVVALPDRLSVRDGEGWQHAAWQDIVSGGWDNADGTLAWRTVDGRAGRVELTEPGSLPDLFRERVTASIVVSHHVDIPGTRGVTVTARRNPASPRGALVWVPVLSPGTDASDPRVAAAVRAAVESARADYDIG